MSLLAVAVTGGAMAQSFVQQEVTKVVARQIELPTTDGNAAATATDTLGWDELGGSLIQYSSASGYVFGTNALTNPQNPSQVQYNLEYARGFLANSAYTVIGAGFIFGSKEDVSGSPAAAKAKLYNIAANRAFDDVQATSATADGPSATMLTSADVAFADADTNFPSMTWVNFDSEAWVGSDFAIGLDISPLYGTPADTLVLLADSDGDSDGLYTWTRIGLSPTAGPSQSLWFQSTAMLQGGLDVNLAIFAVVAESGTGIEEQGFLNGVKMTTYPNPSLASDNITIQYGLETAAKRVDVNIYSTTGQLVYNAAQGAKASGVYRLNVPAGTLSAGSYIYTIDADGKRMAKRMEVLK